MIKKRNIISNINTKAKTKNIGHIVTPKLINLLNSFSVSSCVKQLKLTEIWRHS